MEGNDTECADQSGNVKTDGVDCSPNSPAALDGAGIVEASVTESNHDGHDGIHHFSIHYWRLFKDNLARRFDEQIEPLLLRLSHVASGLRAGIHGEGVGSPDDAEDAVKEARARIAELESDQTHTARRLRDALAERDEARAFGKKASIEAFDNGIAGDELQADLDQVRGALVDAKSGASRLPLRHALDEIATGSKGEWSCNCPAGEIARAALTPPVEEKADEFGLDLGLKPDATVRVKARVEDLSPSPDLVALVREYQAAPSMRKGNNLLRLLLAFDLTAHRKAPDAS